VGWIAWIKFVPDRWVYKKKFQTSELIIQEAETFRQEYDRVPNNQELAALMKKHGWQSSERCPCYDALSASGYMVWFGYKTVGGSMVYRSDYEIWSEER